MKQEMKKGWCFPLFHRWTKWSAPNDPHTSDSRWPEHGWINPNQWRYCVKCGKYERRWVPS